jgi:hypothetical protein
MKERTILVFGFMDVMIKNETPSMIIFGIGIFGTIFSNLKIIQLTSKFVISVHLQRLPEILPH